MFDARLLAPDQIHPITAVEFERMLEAAVFSDEARLELLRGVIVEVNPQGGPHADTVSVLHELLTLALHGRARVRGHSPYAALPDSRPEPDLLVVRPERYLSGHPNQAFLAIEVSLSSLQTDRLLKGSIYAENGIPEYWIVNLKEGAVEVYTDPGDDTYANKQTYVRGAGIPLSAFPDVCIRVDDFMPPHAAAE